MIESVGTAASAVSGEPLTDVLGDLGSALLHLVAGNPDRSPDVRGVAIIGPGDEEPVAPGSFVLGVGLRGNAELAATVRRLAEQGASALVVSAPVDLNGTVRSAIAEGGLTLVGLAAGARWQQLSSLLWVRLQQPRWEPGPGGDWDGMATGDLFGLAEAIRAVVHAPITIEDRNSNVLAFSSHQDDADFIRIDCILGRRTPDAIAREDELRGAYRQIRSCDGPVYLPPMVLADERETKARVAMAVRAGDELLGSIWAVVAEPFSPEQERLFADAARVVALHLLQLRAGADANRRLLSDLMATALEGGAEAGGALARLQLEQSPLVLLAGRCGTPGPLAHPDPQLLGRLAADRERAARALEVQLAGTRPGAVVAVVRDIIYALVPAPTPAGAVASLRRLCESFLHRAETLAECRIGIGRVVSNPAELPRAREDAHRALRVLGQRPGQRVAAAADIEVDALLLELRDQVESQGREPSGAYARILDYDRVRQSFMVETLCAWLDAGGDINQAALASHVHQNTFRYRLRRLTEVGEFDPDDAAAVFELELQRRVFPPVR